MEAESDAQFVEGVLSGVPSNVTVLFEATYTLDELKAKPGDEHMLVQILALCGQTITQKHEQASSVITHVAARAHGLELLQYVVHVRMPLQVRITDKHVAAIRRVNELRVRGLEWFVQEGAVQLDIRVDSTSNPLDVIEMQITNVHLVHTQHSVASLVTEEQPDEKRRGTNKRIRHSAPTVKVSGGETVY